MASVTVTAVQSGFTYKVGVDPYEALRELEAIQEDFLAGEENLGDVTSKNLLKWIDRIRQLRFKLEDPEREALQLLGELTDKILVNPHEGGIIEKPVLYKESVWEERNFLAFANGRPFEAKVHRLALDVIGWLRKYRPEAFIRPHPPSAIEEHQYLTLADSGLVQQSLYQTQQILILTRNQMELERRKNRELTLSLAQENRDYLARMEERVAPIIGGLSARVGTTEETVNGLTQALEVQRELESEIRGHSSSQDRRVLGLQNRISYLERENGELAARIGGGSKCAIL